MPAGVLVTRPTPGATETAGLLAKRGYRPVLAPCLVLHGRAGRLPPAANVQAVLLTSGAAADALPLAFHATRVLAVGDATAARARATGCTDVQSADGDATALAELVGRLCQPAAGPLLLACGTGQGAPLSATLRQRGFAVLRRVIYHAGRPAALPKTAIAALERGEIATVLLYSAQSAQNFAGLLPARIWPALASIDALAISPATAMPVQHLPWRRVHVALRPTQDALLGLLP